MVPSAFAVTVVGKSCGVGLDGCVNRGVSPKGTIAEQPYRAVLSALRKRNPDAKNE